MSDNFHNTQVSEDNASSSDEKSNTQDCNDVPEVIDCCECEIKSEEEQKPSDCTVAALRLSPVTTLVNNSKTTC